MNLKYVLGVIITAPLLPLMYFQGKKIRANVPILPEAKGIEGKSIENSNRTLRLITIGDSSMAGVGVETHKEGFTGNLANELASKFSADVIWKVYAKSGYTAKKVKDILVPSIEEGELDLIVIAVGGNDALKLTSLKAWIHNIKGLIAAIRIKYKQQPIVFINMPPIQDIPVFTSLIKFIIGGLMDIFSDVLQNLVKDMDGVYYYPRKIIYKEYVKRFHLDADASAFFSDGFHASKLAYQVWAKDVSNFLVEEKEVKTKLEYYLQIQSSKSSSDFDL